MRESWYDTAQVCINGHVVNDASIAYPQSNQDFCDKCGEETITKCQKCGTNIKGYYHISGVASIGFKYIPPSYCYKCGSSFPWTEEKLKAAIELADLLDELSEEDQEELKKSLNDLVKDGPKTVVATTKFKRILSKTGPEIITGFKNILIDVVSETAKKAIWG